MTKDNIEKEDKSPMPDDKGDFLIPPSGYDEEIAQTFADLPYQWRRYLNAREEEIDKGFCDLRSRIAMYKWLENTYEAMASELRKDGIASQEDWLHKLINVEKQLRIAPQAAIKMLAESYGVIPPVTTSDAYGKNFDNIWSAQIVEKQIQDFADSKDEAGQLKHPFYQDVVKDIYQLLKTGTATNLEDAYDMAVWLNKTTRSKMIAHNVDTGLQNKSKEAQKAKNVAFTVSGKAEPDYKKMSLREELEHRFASLGLIDE